MRQEASSDLALIVGPVMSKDGCEATLGPPAARGDVVWTTGWPPDEEPQVTTGHIRAILVMHGNRNYLASPDTGPGWSGGPLWNHRGALIGVVRAGYALATPFGTVYKASRTLYVHTSYRADFLSGGRTKDGGIIE
jgi:S1-C subfamily serine protease